MSKRIVLAVDSFKGSASSLEIESYIEIGIKEILPEAECVKIPIADGGEGTVEAIVTARDGVYREVAVQDPLGRPVTARYGLLQNGVAVLEMSTASGITLVTAEERNPLLASTYGTGQMILDALEQGCKEIFMGIGGSATNDGGLGMAMALGVRFLDEEGQALPAEALSLERIATIDMSGLDERVKQTKFTILCDVDNPLCGPNGASYIYGGQKGADEAMKARLDAALAHYAAVLKDQLGQDIIDVPGAGAAGGLGAGMMVFTQAHTMRGIDAVLALVKMDCQIAKADLVVTGEGCMDNQTAFGKAPVGIALLGQKHQVPVVAVVGGIAQGTEAVYEKGISLVFDIVNQPMVLDEAIANVAVLAKEAGKNVGRLLKNWTFNK